MLISKLVKSPTQLEVAILAEEFSLSETTLEWLLEPENPSVRMNTLRFLLDQPEHDQDVRQAAEAINTSLPVKTILEHQESGGHWAPEKSFYTGKYKSTVWTLLVLAELDADAHDERIQSGCQFILENAQHRESGAFSQRGGRNGGQASGVIPCLTGNMLWVLVRFGFLDDPRVQSAIDWIVQYQRFDDGDGKAPSGWPYDNWEICWGRHTCHMGVVKTLKALAAIPEEKRSKDVRQTIGQAAEFILMHHVFKRSHNLARVSKPGWKKFGFPLMYQTDVLEILNLLLDLGYRDARMEEAVELVQTKQCKDGRWKLENCYNTLVPIETKGKASKWITMNALRSLKRGYAISKLA